MPKKPSQVSNVFYFSFCSLMLIHPYGERHKDNKKNDKPDCGLPDCRDVDLVEYQPTYRINEYGRKAGVQHRALASLGIVFVGTNPLLKKTNNNINSGPIAPNDSTLFTVNANSAINQIYTKQPSINRLKAARIIHRVAQPETK